MPASEDQHCLRLLALDGGGIRGVAELVILDDLMHRIKHLNHLDELPRPCQYFDIICGTSTGGLIALMIGRLRMSTQDALKEYAQLAGEVFGEKKWRGQDGTFKASKLERAIKSIVAKYGSKKDSEESMLDSSTCRVFVCAKPALSPIQPILLRSYEIPQASLTCKIWEAARATSAAPTFFKRIKLGLKGMEQEFIDAGLGCNNPVQQVIEEAQLVFGDNRRVKCILSIGTGQAETVGLQTPDAFQKFLPTDVIKVLKSLATQTEETAESFEKRYKNIPGVYFRFNVEQGMQRISLEEWNRLGEVHTHTQQYLNKVLIKEKADTVAKLLAEAEGRGERGGLPAGGVTVGQLLGPSPKPETRNKHWVITRSSSPHFTGREDILGELYNHLVSVPASSRKVSLLYGLGGSGKSQICLKFCETHRKRYWGVFWLDGESLETIQQSFRAIARAIKVEETPAAVKQYLAMCEDRWLLIIDNADDPDTDVSKHFPSGNVGTIIITSRNPECRRHAPELNYQVDVLNQDDAINLLLKVALLEKSHADIKVKGDAEKIVTTLGHLALAIDQAGSYIANYQCNLAEYISLYNGHRKELMLQRTAQGSHDYEKAVYTTWEISFEAMCQKNPISSEILQILPFFHHEKISREIFERASDVITKNPEDDRSWISARILEILGTWRDGQWDTFVFDSSMRELQSFSLIQIGMEDNGPVYFLHPLVHSWTLDRMDKDSKLAFRRLATSLIWRSITSTNGRTLADHIFRSQLLPHVDRCQKLTELAQETEDAYSADIMFHFAGIYDAAGLWKNAEELYIRTQTINQTLHGVENPETLTTMHSLAETYQSQGRWKEAEELQVQVLEMRKRVMGQEHPDTLHSMNNLALTYESQGRWKQAEELQVQVLEMRKRVMGQKHPATLTSMKNLAGAYRSQGRWKEAEELEVQVLETRRRVLGQEHPDTLHSMNNLALTYGSQGRWKQAKELEVQVLETRKRVLGQEHPHTLTSMNNLASTYGSQGRWKQAEELQVQVLETRKRVLGQEHPHTLTSMSNLASTYGSQGRWKQAEELQVQVLETCKRVLGQEHPDTLTSMNNLAYTHMNLGKPEAAITLMKQAVELRRKIIGDEHPHTVLSMETLSSWLNDSRGRRHGGVMSRILRRISTEPTR